MYESSNKFMMIGIISSVIFLFMIAFSVKSYTPKKFQRKKYKLVRMKIIKKKEVKKEVVKKEMVKREIVKKEFKKEFKKEIKKEEKPKKVSKKKKKRKIVKKVPPKNPINRKKKEEKKEEKKEVKKEENVPIFGVSMNSTTSGNSGFKVQMGNTLMTDDTTGWEKGKPKKIGEYNPDNFIAEKDVKKVVKKRKKRAKIVKKAIPKKIVRPKYTNLAKDEEIEGKIILKITIDKNGKVIKVKVLKGLGYGLDEEAVRAVKRFKFIPALLDNGNHTASTITYTINFILED